jgi:hypothetical protein
LWAWYYNGNALSGQTSNTLYLGGFSIGDNITCQETPADQLHLLGASVNSSVVALGTLPPDTITLLLNSAESNYSAGYGSPLTVSAYAPSGTELLFMDGTEVSNPYTATLSPGYYTFMANSTGDGDYNATSPETFSATISKAPSTLDLVLNGGIVARGTQSNVTCTLDNAQAPISLYRNDVLVNSSSDGGSISDVGYLPLGDYSYACTCGDSENYTAATEADGTLQVVSVYINSAAVLPAAVVNGSQAQLYINASNAQSVWANVTLPNGSSEIIPLTNTFNTPFGDTSQLGQYNVTFYANSSGGDITNASGTLGSYLPLSFNVTVMNSSSSGINSTWTVSYSGTTVASSSSPVGNYSGTLPNALMDLGFGAYSGLFGVTLSGINISMDNNLSFGMDNPDIPGYLVAYSVDNPFNFTNATVVVYYTGTAYTNEASLRLFKCEDFDFAAQACDGSWTDYTPQAVQNTAGHYFSFPVSEFSGFAVQQGPWCGDGTCNNGETCSTCPLDCGVCPSAGSTLPSGAGSPVNGPVVISYPAPAPTAPPENNTGVNQTEYSIVAPDNMLPGASAKISVFADNVPLANGTLQIQDPENRVTDVKLGPDGSYMFTPTLPGDYVFSVPGSSSRVLILVATGQPAVTQPAQAVNSPNPAPPAAPSVNSRSSSWAWPCIGLLALLVIAGIAAFLMRKKKRKGMGGQPAPQSPKYRYAGK